MPDTTEPTATAAQRKGGYESGDGPLPESLPTGSAPGAQRATTTAAQRECAWFDANGVVQRGEHSLILQPFYNQDGRLWCQQCWVLAPAEHFGVRNAA